MRHTKNQKLLNSQNLGKKKKLQNFGLSQTRKFQRFFFRKESKNFIVFDKLTSEIFFINKTTKEIISLLNKRLSIEEIVRKISNKYHISEERAIKGVNLVLGNLE